MLENVRTIDSENVRILIDVILAHLPDDKSFWYVSDHLLKDAADQLTKLQYATEENVVFKKRLHEKNGGDGFGAIIVDTIQPVYVWALTFKEAGKRRVAFSFDGAPSDAYIPLVDRAALEEAQKQMGEAMKEIMDLKLKLEIERADAIRWRSLNRRKTK